MATVTASERLKIREECYRFWVATYRADDGVWVQVAEGESEAEALANAEGYLAWAAENGIKP